MGIPLKTEKRRSHPPVFSSRQWSRRAEGLPGMTTEESHGYGRRSAPPALLHLVRMVIPDHSSFSVLRGIPMVPVIRSRRAQTRHRIYETVYLAWESMRAPLGSARRGGLSVSCPLIRAGTAILSTRSYKYGHILARRVSDDRAMGLSFKMRNEERPGKTTTPGNSTDPDGAHE